MPARRPSEYIYRPAWWVPGPHGQTLWGRFFRRSPLVRARTERWETPDGDFIDIYRLAASPGAPRLFLLHGLEGTVQSHYVAGFFSEAERRGWGADLLVFRGCGLEPNRARRFYHSGETTDLSFALTRVLEEDSSSPIGLAGVSLGGNVLLKYLGEVADAAPERVRAAGTVSVPYDLERGSRHISRGFSRIYDRHFLRSLRRKAEAKLLRYPDLFDSNALRRARTIYDFDDVVTAPVHGFRNAEDYYTRSSSLRWLARVRRHTLLLSAVDDPFLPPAVLDEVREIASANPYLNTEFTARGGHVGFVGGALPWRPRYYAEWRICEFLAGYLA